MSEGLTVPSMYGESHVQMCTHMYSVSLGQVCTHTHIGAQIFMRGLLLPLRPRSGYFLLPCLGEPGHEPDSDPDFFFLPPGKSALHWAAAVNNVEATLALLKNGANKDMQDSKVSPSPWPIWGSALV